MVEEGEQVVANLAVSPAQALTMSVCGSERHDGIKRAIQLSAVFAPCALGQIAAAPGNHHGAQQQRLHRRGEDGCGTCTRRCTGKSAILHLKAGPWWLR